MNQWMNKMNEWTLHCIKKAKTRTERYPIPASPDPFTYAVVTEAMATVSLHGVPTNQCADGADVLIAVGQEQIRVISFPEPVGRRGGAGVEGWNTWELGRVQCMARSAHGVPTTITGGHLLFRNKKWQINNTNFHSLRYDNVGIVDLLFYALLTLVKFRDLYVCGWVIDKCYFGSVCR